MSRLSEVTLPLVERLLDSVADDAAWPMFLDSLAREVGGVVPGLYIIERVTDSPLFTEVSGLDPTWGRAYEQYYKRCDPRRVRIQALPAGSVFVGSALVDDRKLVQSEFYNEFLRPQGFFHIVGGVPLENDDLVAVLRVIRPRSAPAFGRREAALIHRLMPHLSRALRLHQRLTVAAARRDEAAEVLDWFPTGVLLLDTSGRVVAANRVAEEILASGDGLRAGGEGLRADFPAESAVLRRLIAEIGHGTAVIDPSGGVLNLTRPSGARPLNLLVAPLRGKLLSQEAPRAAVVVFVSDPDRLPSTPVDRVQRWLGLTRAEASLVLQLIRGCRVEDAADVLGISPQTARTQLKRALAKTSTGRQAELIRLALGTPAVLSR
jgi:DNA-binding CsgD family transcriptional regulator/GAF domain-containing protein